MKLLAIDTAFDQCSAAVLVAGEGQVLSIHCERRPGSRGHAEILFDVIETVLRSAHVSREAIDRIAVNCGPGSFTGLRVGIAAARGLALALQCECVGVSALAGLARGCEPAGRRQILTLLDAGRGEAVCQRFDGVTHAALDAPQTMTCEQAAIRFADFDGVITGSGLRRCFPEGVEGRRFSVFEQDWADIEILARIGCEGVPEGPVKPFYSRAADAKPQISANLVAE